MAGAKVCQVSSEIREPTWVTGGRARSDKLKCPLHLELLLHPSQPTVNAPELARGIALLVDVGRDTADLLKLWLGTLGLNATASISPEQRPRLVLLERAYPRHDEKTALQDVGRRFPGIPVVLLSPTLFATVPARGEVARSLGVAAVLATPLAREQLLRTITELLGS